MDLVVPDIDEAAFDFLDRLLLMDPYKCITIEDVLHSFLFNNYRKGASDEPSSEETFQFDLNEY